MAQETDKDDSPVSETILLTGVGFTKDFGGYLSEEMWAIIFSHPAIQRQLALRKFMLDQRYDFNFELIYHHVLGKRTPVGKDDLTYPWSAEFKMLPFTPSEDDRKALRMAVSESYRGLDRAIVASIKGPEFLGGDKNVILLNQFLDRFTGAFGQRDFFFTLNQDIFVERYRAANQKTLTLPGMNRMPAISDSFKGDRPFNEGEDILAVPMDSELDMAIPNEPAEFNGNEHHYIKLHGSFNWLRTDGSDAMVIGYQKDAQIESEHLLDRYFEIFRKVLSLLERRLMVIGYGFRDPHINSVIANAIENYGLKLYIISPESPRDFVDMRRRKPHPFSGETYDPDVWQKIIGGLSGYYPSSLLYARKIAAPKFDIFDGYFQ